MASFNSLKENYLFYERYTYHDMESALDTVVEAQEAAFTLSSSFTSLMPELFLINRNLINFTVSNDFKAECYGIYEYNAPLSFLLNSVLSAEFKGEINVYYNQYFSIDSEFNLKHLVSIDHNKDIYTPDVAKLNIQKEYDFRLNFNIK